MHILVQQESLIRFLWLKMVYYRSDSYTEHIKLIVDILSILFSRTITVH